MNDYVILSKRYDKDISWRSQYENLWEWGKDLIKFNLIKSFIVIYRTVEDRVDIYIFGKDEGRLSIETYLSLLPQKRREIVSNYPFIYCKIF